MCVEEFLIDLYVVRTEWVGVVEPTPEAIKILITFCRRGVLLLGVQGILS